MSDRYFNGFKWAIPEAFLDAVAACRFEEGDILYDTKKAYSGEWDTAEPHVKHSLQVRSPERGPAAVKSGGAVFGRNWDSEVTFELEDAENGGDPRLVRTTQGRLYTALWHGDLSVLDSDSDPEIPLQLQQVLKMLDEVIPKAKTLASENAAFIMARDATNRISRLKHLKVSSVLHTHFKADCKVLSPKSAGLAKWEQVAPTIDIRVYVTEQGAKDEIHDLLKEQLYGQSKDAKPEDEKKKKDNFKLSRHGLLVAD